MAKIDLKGKDDESEGESSDEQGNSSDSESSDENYKQSKPKGVSNLIEIENPNRMPKKVNRKYYTFIQFTMKNIKEFKFKDKVGNRICLLKFATCA